MGWAHFPHINSGFVTLTWEMSPTYVTDVRDLSVSVLVTTLSLAKTAERIELQFSCGLMEPKERNHALDGDSDPPLEGALFGTCSGMPGLDRGGYSQPYRIENTAFTFSYHPEKRLTSSQTPEVTVTSSL